MPEAKEVYNIRKWIDQNKDDLKPPVCNKPLYDTQMMAFVVGGPNDRNDYHIEEGEELFYMFRGDMCLKVVERGIHKDIHIREGEMFLLPAKILHSPQRKVDTIGLVIERERSEDEKDGVIYYVIDENGKPTADLLYNKYIHLESVTKSLVPLIKAFFQSEQYRTGKPDLKDLDMNPPIIPDNDTLLALPFNLHDWLVENQEIIQKQGHLNIFPSKGQFDVQVLGEGYGEYLETQADTFIWVLNGQVQLILSDDQQIQMQKDDCVLIPKGEKMNLKRSQGSYTIKILQYPTNK